MIAQAPGKSKRKPGIVTPETGVDLRYVLCYSHPAKKTEYYKKRLPEKYHALIVEQA
jgi:hypothetical protein